MQQPGESNMTETVDPANMTPEERLGEFAGILARGLLRLHARAATGGEKSAPKL